MSARVIVTEKNGLIRGVLVDALQESNGRARGVAVLASSVTNQELLDLHAAGVRGVRFNFVKRLVDVTPREVPPLASLIMMPSLTNTGLPASSCGFRSMTMSK